MKHLRRRLVFAAVILITVVSAASTALTRSQKDRVKEAGGTISGRVTSDGQPIRSVVVYLQASGPQTSETPRVTGRTDANGHFELKGVPAGTYSVQAFAPSLITSDPLTGRQGTVINLSENEIVDRVDIALRPGGVIAGRVTDVDGNPLIQESIKILTIDGDNRRRQIYLPFSYMFSTDDRGEYRIFGLPPGKYLASVGVDTSNPAARFNQGNTYHEMTFYPDTTDPTKATMIEVAAGSEASGIDIVVGKPTKGYSVSGRIIDATTGRPVIGMMYGYGTYDLQRQMLNSSVSGGATSTARGEFRIDGISPGKYAAFATPRQDTNLYSDLAQFAITDGDVSGVVVTVHQGGTISGNVIIEGADGPSKSPRPSDVRLNCAPISRDVPMRANQVQIAPDGSFRVIGIPGGAVTFSMAYPYAKGLTISRIERDGVNQTVGSAEREGRVNSIKGLQVGAGEEISGVNIVLSYGTGSIRGQVEFEGADFPSNAVLYLNLRRADSSQQMDLRTPTPDVRGRFLIEGLQSGEYEISLFVNASLDGKRGINKTVTQKVSVTNGAETQVTVRVEPNPQDR